MSGFFFVLMYCFTVHFLVFIWNIQDYLEQHHCFRKNFITCISFKWMYVFKLKFFNWSKNINAKLAKFVGRCKADWIDFYIMAFNSLLWSLEDLKPILFPRICKVRTWPFECDLARSELLKYLLGDAISYAYLRPLFRM